MAGSTATTWTARLAGGFRKIWIRLRRHGVRHWLRRERQSLAQTATVTLGCLMAWWIAAKLAGTPQPVLAPTVVLLSVTATAYSTVVQGIQQTVAVTVLVGLAAGVRGLPGQKDAWSFPQAFPDLFDTLGEAYASFGRLQVGSGHGKDLAQLRDAVREGERAERAVHSQMSGIDPQTVLWSLGAAGRLRPPALRARPRPRAPSRHRPTACA